MLDMEQKRTRGELALQILALCIVGGAVLTAAVLPGLPQIMKLCGVKTAKDRYRIKRSVEGLEHRGFIVRNGSGHYSLTKKGRTEVAVGMLEKQVIQKSPTWDKKWRVLMFDIPEEFAYARREASVLIREMGMKKIQNSVFISPYPCTKEIKKLAKHYHIEQFLIYLETETISESDSLKKYFGLR